MPDGGSSLPETRAPIDAPARREGRRTRAVVIALVGVGALAVGARLYMTRHQVTTDEAIVVARTVAIAPEITARAVRIHVKNHQTVERGAVLVELDPLVFEQSVAKARGELHIAEALAHEAELRLEVARKQNPVRLQVAREDQAEAVATRQSIASEIARVEAQAAGVEAALTLARQELDRSRALHQTGSLSNADLDQRITRVTLLAAEQKSLTAQLASAKARNMAAAGAVRSAGGRASMVEENAEPALAESGHALARARVEQAAASVALAEADLARTKIVAPIAGVVEHLEVEAGMLVGPTSSALSIVSTDDVWIEARVKETDIHRVRSEQGVRIRVDALGSRDLAGHVDGVGHATLSRFAALPVEASGSHFVRVTQRVPVRIRLDDRPEGMRAGLNAIVTIHGTP